MGLDVMTVLGSDQAYEIAKEDFGQDQYKNWESQIEKVNERVRRTRPPTSGRPTSTPAGWSRSSM